MKAYNAKTVNVWKERFEKIFGPKKLAHDCWRIKTNWKLYILIKMYTEID